MIHEQTKLESQSGENKILNSTCREIYTNYKVQYISNSHKQQFSDSVSLSKTQTGEFHKKKYFLYSTFSHYGHVGYDIPPLKKYDHRLHNIIINIQKFGTGITFLIIGCKITN
jgi:hypothetical protein